MVDSMWWTIIAPLLLVSTAAQQIILEQEQQTVNDTRPRLAIIGAGIAGASAAWELQRCDERGMALPHEITVYERTSSIGGRVQSIASSTVGINGHFETGATHLYPDDWCLKNGAESVGLSTGGITAHPGSGEGVATKLQCDYHTPSWSSVARLSWKYGRSPWTFHKAVVSVGERWQRFALFAMSTSLEGELVRNGLDGDLLHSARDYLTGLGVSEEFQQDVVQPCVKARSYQDLSDVSGLAALIAVSGDPLKVKNRNNALLERMMRLSYAAVHFDTDVTAVKPGNSRRYRLNFSTVHDGVTQAGHAEYDSVIIATPLLASGIDLSGLDLEHDPTQPTFLASHVTHLATHSTLTRNSTLTRLDVAVTDGSKSRSFRADVLTSSAKHPSDILSIHQTLKCDFGPCTPGDECDDCDPLNLYRIHSRHRLCDADFARLLANSNTGSGTDSRLQDHKPSWLHRQHWHHAFPVRHASGHLSSQKIELAPRLFCLGVAEEVVSSMEMSCRMGRWAATTLYYQDSGWRL